MQGLNFDAVLAAIEKILEVPPESPGMAASLWPELDISFNRMLDATKVDSMKQGPLTKLLAKVSTAASRLKQSLTNAKITGPVREDWMRFAERDLVAFKDELLALKEFMVEEADFLRFVCLRAQLKDISGANPERLFSELHEAGAISERTWVLLMAQPNSWRNVRRNHELSKQLELISVWLLDLQEMRRELRAYGEARITTREKSSTDGGPDDVQKP